MRVQLNISAAIAAYYLTLQDLCMAYWRDHLDVYRFEERSDLLHALSIPSRIVSPGGDSDGATGRT